MHKNLSGEPTSSFLGGYPDEPASESSFKPLKSGEPIAVSRLEFFLTTGGRYISGPGRELVDNKKYRGHHVKMARRQDHRSVTGGLLMDGGDYCIEARRFRPARLPL